MIDHESLRREDDELRCRKGEQSIDLRDVSAWVRVGYAYYPCATCDVLHAICSVSDRGKYISNRRKHRDHEERLEPHQSNLSNILDFPHTFSSMGE